MYLGLMSTEVGWAVSILYPFADTLVKILYVLYSGKFASFISPKKGYRNIQIHSFTIFEHHCVPTSILDMRIQQ